ncbi:MAG TPA: EAL domain-containing protein [Solimonas sp.]|nr:EAL domain-containing protein [Solimonas sp.]
MPYPEVFAGLYFGFVLAVALFSLATAMIWRDDTSIPWFSMTCIAAVLWLFVWQGRYPGEPDVQVRLMPMLGVLFLLLLIRYGQLALGLAQQLPKLDTFLRALMGFLLALVALSWFAPTWGLRLLAPSALLACAALLGGSCLRLRQRYWLGTIEALGMTLMFIGLAPNALSWLGVMLSQPPGFWMNLFQLCSGAAITVFGLGIVSSLNRSRLERVQELDLAVTNQRMALNRASIDHVTRLPDFKLFCDQLQKRLTDAQSGQERLAVVSISLPTFRALRHGVGSRGADAGMAEIALRLRQGINSGDLLSPTGRDGFVLVTPVHPTGDLLDLRGRCASLRRDLGSPLANAGGVMLNSDFGVALYPEHGADVELLLRRSDEALYDAERAGIGEIGIFKPESQQQSHQDMRLAKQLQQALLGDELVLYYQPMLGLDHGELRGAEALIRWQRDGVLVPPGEFIPVAEACGLIVPLGEWVMQRACQQISEWETRGLVLPYISVNVSAHQFRNVQFLKQVDRIINTYPHARSRLMLEITETMVLDDVDRTAKLLQQLLDRGVFAAVDDFGVGYSSLNYLRKLPLRAVKIDRSFLQGIPNEADAVSVIGSIIALGQDLGLQVVAEGVETVEQQLFLAQRGVTSGQGFLFSRPLPAEDFEKWASRLPQARATA